MKSENLDLAVKIRDVLKEMLVARRQSRNVLYVDNIELAAMKVTDLVEGLD